MILFFDKKLILSSKMMWLDRKSLMLKTGMLDLKITGYTLTINESSYLQEYIQYLVDYTYNNRKTLKATQGFS